MNEELSQFMPGRAPLGCQGLRPHLPQGHKKEDFRQVKGHVHSEAGLVDGGDGLWGRVGVGSLKSHSYPHRVSQNNSYMGYSTVPRDQASLAL